METVVDLPVRDRPPALAALKDCGSVGIGLVPLGLAFGAFLTHSGLDWWWATIFTTFIYAGSFEFLLIGLAAAAAPLASIGLSAFLVNVRHVFYALSFPLHRVRGRGARAYSTFALTDESYALSTTDSARDWDGARILWLQLFLHLFWVGGATAGGLLGSLIPSSVVGLDFAMTALFVVLAIDAVRERREDVPTPILAALSAGVARVVFPGQMLLVAFLLFTVALLVRCAFRGRTASDA
ncbi:AzlC family ABC transporter permease [Amycolatopsis sp. WGS_07]|uniref:AzlC family ABC transporter permease n=1 Tax=Amycolatopsis sp. WGS_07 TaxID=3076764 RepID=UPI003872F16E